MIVKSLESPVFYRKKRNALPGKGLERVPAKTKSFDQYLLEAFQGEVVKEGENFSSNLSEIARDNLIRLSR